MKLAGLKECGLCCEIMRDDGTMMRTPELKEMAQKYNLKFITIACFAGIPESSRQTGRAGGSS